MKRALVTGGAGFIGSHLVEGLLAEGTAVTVLDNFSTGHRANLPEDPKLFVIEGSICDADCVARAIDGVDVVLHQAALPSVPRSIQNPVATCRVNIEGTAVLLEAARVAGVRRVIGAGSSSVYGDTVVLPKSETLPLNPLSPYAVSKLAMEKLFATYHRIYGLETVVLRYFNVFGPRQDPASQYAAVIPLFIESCRSGSAPTIFGDGEQSRDFTYVANVVRANRLAANAPNAGGKVLNVACAQRHTVNRLAAQIREYAGTGAEPLYKPARPGDVKHSEADITLARQVLNYSPEVRFEDGLQRTVQWFLGRE